MSFHNYDYLIMQIIYFGAGISFLYSIGQLCGRQIFIENVIISVLQFCIGILMLQISFIVTGIIYEHSELMFFHLTFLYLVSPLTFFSYYVIIYPLKTLRRKLIYFIPVLITLPFDIIYVMMPETERFKLLQNFFNSDFPGEALIIKLIIVGAGLQFFLYFGYLFKKILLIITKEIKKSVYKFILFDIIVILTITMVFITGYCIGSQFMMGLGLLITSVLTIFSYFVSQRYPQIYQLLMFRAEKKYYDQSSIAGLNISPILDKMKSLMEVDRLYKDDTLSLRQLAEKLSINQRQLSQLLHEHFKNNFHNYINNFRINEAMGILINEPE